jgi:hypothetical protein
MVIRSKSFVGLRSIFSFFFTATGFITLLLFITLGQICCLSRWGVLLSGWDPYQIPVFYVFIYLFLLIISVLFHEMGHLIVASYKGDFQAFMCVEFKSWRPIFMTRRKIDTDPGSIVPVFYLAGVLAQFFFASILGVLFFLTNNDALPESIVLIDIAAASSLLLSHGSDGSNFVNDILRQDAVRKVVNGDNYDSKRTHLSILRKIFAGRDRVKITLAVLTVTYLILFLFVSSLLFAGINYQFLEGTIHGVTQGKWIAHYTVLYFVAVAPSFTYLLWGINSIPAIVNFLKYFSARRAYRETSPGQRINTDVKIERY